jgi:hypothetical protein
VPVFFGGRNFGLDLGGFISTGGRDLDFILDSTADTAPVYSGYWSSIEDGQGHRIGGILDLLAANTVDPAGGSDYFVNGVLALAGMQLN